jgi:hypothetical protein
MITLTSESTNIQSANGSLSVVLDDGSWSSTLTEMASSAISSVEYQNGVMEITFHRANSVSDSETYSFTSTESASTEMYEEIANVLSNQTGSVGSVYNNLITSGQLTKIN